MTLSFSKSKLEFDKKFATSNEFSNFLPEHLQVKKTTILKGKNGAKNEQYYKWQFLFSLINSGMYIKDYVGTEVYFPKGNKNSAPIKFDCAIFDDVNWFEHYQSYHLLKDQGSLDWLRRHIIAVVEIKKEDSKDIETIWNQQLKPALKESENGFCLGVIYDTERLYLFKKQGDLFLRLNEGFNTKKEDSQTKDLQLHLTDSYNTIPSFEQLIQKVYHPKIDRSKRTIDDLEVISGVYSTQLTDGISTILRTMDKVSMQNQRGYEILIQIIALKIYDEKRSAKIESFLDWHKTDKEKEHIDLLFFVTSKERNYTKISDDNIQSFIERMRLLYAEASQSYQFILKRDDRETIAWEKEEHIRIIAEVVEQFQDYSFVKSDKSDLYQIVFHKFANAFSKAEKGQFLTPIPIIDFLVQIVNPRSTDKIIDPTSGIADFLSVSYVNSKGTLQDNNIYGLDNDEQMIMLAQLNMLLNGDGNAKLEYKPDKGSITWKFDDRDNLVEINSKFHKNGNWDNWKDQTKLKKFDVVLTNPPFGEDRAFEPKDVNDREAIECYEMWNLYGGKKIDLGVVFLENAYRILKDNGRIGIVLSNSIASIDTHKEARKWLMKKMRIVAIFDLPANVFGETGVNTSVIVAYKPSDRDLKKLQEQNYQVFFRGIEKVGYEVKTSKRVKFFSPIYKINPINFETVIDDEGQVLLDEEFTDTIHDFKKWCNGQEKTLQDLFIKRK
ncbi:HsdM family class I SAM-dependent methyltransferase [Mucilaginibacter gilvus]|uniref:SAM-dependent methyltransferase n=1 Tax=Mucilaginibacter gilvus TaxID=2305909 RepID=A0A444MJU9_9SPHI|nr:N-6 DNA methylase [Mucilaginibacter gilvus]RWY49080.1 SAM-dependent methyltransferase [Mucilaginibacter gilvus]